MIEFSEDDIKALRALPLEELMHRANREKIQHRRAAFSLCSIMNAKSGHCSEDCKFCGQSVHHQASGTPVYPLKNTTEMKEAAAQAKRDGAEHFSIVTSGRGLRSAEVALVADALEAIRNQVDIKLCASLGILAAADLKRLRDAGLVRYHHNLETSREFFPEIVSTHSFAERIDTIRAAREVGLEVCAGGIFGLGETEEDRVSLALSLKELRVDSVPINILIPLPGTPLADRPPLTILEILRGIALFRLILQGVPIRLAAGRETGLRDFLGMALWAGADGMMIGGYLTQRGRPPAEDLRVVAEMQRLWTG